VVLMSPCTEMLLFTDDDDLERALLVLLVNITVRKSRFVLLYYMKGY
jgi:hypothetical protein